MALIRATSGSGGGGGGGRCIYLGEYIGERQGGGSVATKTFDITSVYSDYANLTVDNFIVAYFGSYAQITDSTSNPPAYVIDAVKTYSASTGILTVKSPYMIDQSRYYYMRYKVYLATNIET